MKNSLSKIFNTGENKLVSLFRFGTFIFTKPGRRLIKKVISGTSTNDTTPLVYDEWLNAQINKTAQRTVKSNQPQEIKISIAISVYMPEAGRLLSAVNSVIGQSWQNWELLVEDVHPNKEIAAIAEKDNRVKIIHRPENTTALLCSDTILNAVTGNYILFITEDDVLPHHCLTGLCSHIQTHTADDLIYADEDTTDDNGNYSAPHFKPGWSPDSLLSRNYIGHNIVVKKELAQQSDISACENYYDLVLRLTETAENIGHIPQVLFHGHTRAFSDEDDRLAGKALAGALKRRGIAATVQDIPGVAGCYHIIYEVTRKDKVSIIIPTRDNIELLKKTIDSVLQKTDYPDYEIIVLNNNSTSKQFFALMQAYSSQQPGKFRCIDANFPFNFAKLMNTGAQHSTGAYLLLLNNDVEVLDEGWMTQMVSYAQHKRTGAVGVKLLYADDTIQHAGIVLGSEEGSEHVHANADKDDNGYFCSLKAATNYAAVTAACLMCRKEVFTEVGGMDEILAVEYNDIDLCLKILQQGYYNIYLPSVTLYHYESATRGHPFRSSASWKQHERELSIFKHKWQPLIDNDPFYNANRRLAFNTPNRL
jgi:GT2 family glycosyltransferase